MTTRTDIHRPSVIRPEDYCFIALDCIKIEGLGDAQFIMRERETLRAHMAHTGGSYSQHEHGGNCMICGNVLAMYTAIFYHEPTNVYVRVGSTCVEKLGHSDNLFNAFRAAVQDAKQAVAGKKKAQAVLDEAGLSAAWALRDYIGSDRAEQIVRDIVGKLVKWGSISEAQVGLIRKLLVDIERRPEIEAERAAKAEAAAPCPSGRVTINGTILCVKVQESDFGKTLKMLVEDKTGFKVWGTLPGAATGHKGDRVVFKATVEPKQDDPKFGFFKRPHLISEEVAS